MKIRALFLVLTIAFLVQTAHFAEHVAQIIQIYAQGVPPPNAQGLLGSVFDFEWVHFAYNISLELALIALWLGYRGCAAGYTLARRDQCHSTAHRADLVSGLPLD